MQQALEIVIIGTTEEVSSDELNANVSLHLAFIVQASSLAKVSGRWVIC